MPRLARTCFWLCLFFLCGVGVPGCGSTASPTGEVDEAARDQRPEAVAELSKLLGTPIPGIRLDAVNRLGALGPKAASAAATIEQMASSDQDEDVRKAATEALVKIKSK